MQKKKVELTREELTKIAGGLVKEKVDDTIDDEKVNEEWADLDDGIRRKVPRKKARKKFITPYD